VTDAGFAFLQDADREGAATDHSGFHRDRLGPQAKDDRG
jgi:hypothetical protein